MKAKFVIYGEPVAKGRPKFSTAGGFVRAYTPAQTASFENLVRLEYQRQCPDIKFEADVPLVIRIDSYFGIPKSASKKQAMLMECKKKRPTTKRDYDNLAKIISDSLNQIAYYDDKQIVSGHIEKWYSAIPRTEVTIEDIQQD